MQETVKYTEVTEKVDTFKLMRGKEKLAFMIASFFFVGYLPLAPGTWGSIAGFFLYYFLIPTTGIYFLPVCLLIFALGLLASEILERFTSVHDDNKIVIDEFLGFAISVAFLPKKIVLFLAALVIFRIFDISKPQPIKYIDEKVKGGFGVMLDDIVAGIFTNIIVRLIGIFI